VEAGATSDFVFSEAIVYTLANANGSLRQEYKIRAVKDSKVLAFFATLLSRKCLIDDSWRVKIV